jgi:hypothetical protein
MWYARRYSGSDKMTKADPSRESTGTASHDASKERGAPAPRIAIGNPGLAQDDNQAVQGDNRLIGIQAGRVGPGNALALLEPLDAWMPEARGCAGNTAVELVDAGLNALHALVRGGFGLGEVAAAGVVGGRGVLGLGGRYGRLGAPELELKAKSLGGTLAKVVGKHCLAGTTGRFRSGGNAAVPGNGAVEVPQYAFVIGGPLRPGYGRTDDQ